MTDRETLSEYYDARYRGDYMSEHSPLEVERVADVLAAIPAATVTTLLDFGCGRGAWMPTLLRRFTEARITGIDISAAAIERAAAEFRDATFAAFDGDRAPYEDSAFDLVFSYHVLEHVLSLEDTAGEMCRVARRWICVCLPCRNDGSLEARVGSVEQTSTGELRFAHDEDGHLRRPTSDELVSAFGANGFAPVALFFANQLWGGIEFLLEAGPSVTRPLFGRRMRAARASLDLGHLAFRAHRAARLPRSDDPPGRKAARSALLCAKPATAVIVAPSRALARREWRRRSHDPHGSAQYAVFERRTP